MSKITRSLILSVGILLLSLACSLPGMSGQENKEEVEPLSPTATNTMSEPISVNPGNQSEGLTAQLEVVVMAGPGAAVGLESFALGSFPFSVTNQNGIYIVSGNGPANYYDMLTRDWGSYEVYMDLDIEISGTCNSLSDPNNLDLAVTMTG
jgi:hypothetical protein